MKLSPRIGSAEFSVHASDQFKMFGAVVVTYQIRELKLKKGATHS